MESGIDPSFLSAPVQVGLCMHHKPCSEPVFGTVGLMVLWFRDSESYSGHGDMQLAGRSAGS